MVEGGVGTEGKLHFFVLFFSNLCFSVLLAVSVTNRFLLTLNNVKMYVCNVCVYVCMQRNVT